MDRLTAGLLGAVAGLATIGHAQASTTPAASPVDTLHVSSYADLLEPVPNAAALLQANDLAQAREPTMSVSDSYQLADWGGPQYHHHDHHHHHAYYRRAHHHHHHHHHSANTYVGVPGVGGVVVHNEH